MSWTPATSIGPRPAHPSRMRILSGHRESTETSQSHRRSLGSSPTSVPLFSHRSTPLSRFCGTFAHRLSKDRADEGAHSRKWKWVYSAQFWCNLSSLGATLLGPLVCVANKGLAQMSKSRRCNTYKKQGVGDPSWVLTLPLLRSSLVTHHSPSPRRHPFRRKLNYAVS
jgi:hypothetical protein